MIRQALVDYLINAAWQLPLLMAGTLVLSRVVSLTARQRCWLWTGFLMLALVLPLRLGSVPLPGAGAEAAALAITPSALADDRPAAPAMQSAPAALTRPDPAFGVRPGVPIAPGLADLLLAAFGLALAAAAARLFAGLAAARRLVRGSRPFPLAPAAAQALDGFAARHGFKRPAVRVCEAIASPATVGVFSPVILVPPGFARVAPDEARAALLHEAAHICRDDFGANLLCEVASLPLAWHPALYPIKAGLQQAREAAADALAATAMRSPQLYAHCLVSLARGAAPQASASAALAMFGRGPLETRVRTLLARRPSGPLAWARTAGAGVPVLAAVVAPALMLHVTPSFAEDRAVAREPVSEPAALLAAAETVPEARPLAPVAVSPQPHPEPQVRSVVIRRDGGRHSHRHQWISQDGTRYTVLTTEAAEPTPAEKRAIERRTRESLSRAQRQVAQAGREAERAVRASAVSIRLGRSQIARAEQQVAAAQRDVARLDEAQIAEVVARAQAAVDAPRIAARIAEAQQQAAAIEDGRIQRALRKAERALKAHPRGGVILDGEFPPEDLPDPPAPPRPPAPPPLPRG